MYVFLICALMQRFSLQGTGKSLSMICASLDWLLNGGGARARRRLLDPEIPPSSSSKLFQSSVVESVAENNNFPDWVNQHAVDSKINRLNEALGDYSVYVFIYRTRRLISLFFSMFNF